MTVPPAASVTAASVSSASACHRRPPTRALTHAPEVVLIYESGPIGAKPSVLPLSIGDGELAETADTVVPTGEIFRYCCRAGASMWAFSARHRWTSTATSTPR